VFAGVKGGCWVSGEAVKLEMLASLMGPLPLNCLKGRQPRENKENQNPLRDIPPISGAFVVAGAIVIATVIGIPSAIFLSEFSTFWVRDIIKSSIEIIVGVPSVVIGFFGLTVLVPFI